MKLTFVILAFNEELHIERCIKSVKLVSNSIYVVDSYSSDKTSSIAESLGAKCLFRKFDSHAKQFNWALTQIDSCEWVVRVDSDEYLTPEIVSSIKQTIISDNRIFNGFSFKRRIHFLSKPIRYGGVSPIEVVRMFRFGFGQLEDRLMDEHVVVEGSIGSLDGEIIDDNQNSLTWWIDKHNRYSSLEALEMFVEEKNSSSIPKFSGSTALRRRLKSVYQNMPISIRATLLFIYRFIFRLGFLDGFIGFLFHFYQGYWYRLLVDSKYHLLVKKLAKVKNKDDVIKEISQVLDISSELVGSKISGERYYE